MTRMHVPLVLAVALAAGLASGGGKFNGGAGSGFASASGSASLGGPALAFTFPSNAVYERTTAAVPAGTLSITDGSPATITAADGIRIAIPASLGFAWAVPEAVTLGGTAAAKVDPAAAVENGGATLVLAVTADFAAGDTLTVDGLAFTNLAYACRLDRLLLDVHHDGLADAGSDTLIGVTVPRPGGLGDGSATGTMEVDAALVALPKGSLIMVR